MSESRVKEKEEDAGTKILQKMSCDHCSQIAEFECEERIDGTERRDDQRAARPFVEMKTAEDK